MKLISIVVPCFNEEENTKLFYDELNKVIHSLPTYQFEIIFVADPSLDNSFNIIRTLAQEDDKVKYIFMARRFGKEASMYAGLKYSKRWLCNSNRHRYARSNISYSRND